MTLNYVIMALTIYFVHYREFVNVSTALTITPHWGCYQTQTKGKGIMFSFTLILILEVIEYIL